MAKTLCPDCGAGVSTRARACPACGRPLRRGWGCCGPLLAAACLPAALWVVLALLGPRPRVTVGGRDPFAPRPPESPAPKAGPRPGPPLVPAPALAAVPFPAGAAVALSRPGGAGNVPVAAEEALVPALSDPSGGAFGRFRGLVAAGRAGYLPNGTRGVVLGAGDGAVRVRVAGGAEWWVEPRHVEVTR